MLIEYSDVLLSLFVISHRIFLMVNELIFSSLSLVTRKIVGHD